MTVDHAQVSTVAGAKGRIDVVKLNTKKSRYKTAKEHPTTKIKRLATVTEGSGVYLRPVMLLVYCSSICRMVLVVVVDGMMIS